MAQGSVSVGVRNMHSSLCRLIVFNQGSLFKKPDMREPELTLKLDGWNPKFSNVLSPWDKTLLSVSVASKVRMAEYDDTSCKNGGAHEAAIDKKDGRRWFMCPIWSALWISPLNVVFSTWSIAASRRIWLLWSSSRCWIPRYHTTTFGRPKIWWFVWDAKHGTFFSYKPILSPHNSPMGRYQICGVHMFHPPVGVYH